MLFLISDPSLHSLQTLQRQLLGCGVSSNTAKARDSSLNSYLKFCELYNLSPFPTTPYQASLYCTYLSTCVSPSTVSNYISGVWYHQKMLGFQDHSSNFMLKQTIKGIHRSSSHIPPSKDVILPVHLVQMYTLLNHSNLNDLMFWLATLLGFRALLRKCHFTLSPHSLQFRDVELLDSGLKLTIRSSKTDQLGSKPSHVFVTKVANHIFCPMYHLTKILSFPQFSPHDHLFQVVYKGKLVPMSYNYYRARLSEVGKASGLNIQNLTPHSLRHSGATYLQSLGIPLDVIKSRGNWSSSAVSRYLHPSDTYLQSLDEVPSKSFSMFK